MSDQLFDRRCVVLVGKVPTPGDFSLTVANAVRIEGLRITFKVEKDLKPTPNSVEITIFNLSAATRSKLEGVGQRIILQAGYPGTEAQIFSGDLRSCHSTKQGTDWVTKMDAGDGARSLSFARVRESYKPGMSLSEAAKRTVKSLKQDPGNALAKVTEIAGEFASGYAQSGRASTELTRLLEPHGYTWSIQDGRIEVLKKDEPLAETGPLISSDTGMVGSPTVSSPERPGQRTVVKVRSLLLPRLRPAHRFKLDSEAMQGELRAQRVVHTGDTHGGSWFTDIEATPL